MESKRETKKAQNRLLKNLMEDGCGIAAMIAAEQQNLSKQKGERDTEFVKRIALAYNRAVIAFYMQENLTKQPTGD